MNHKNKRKIVFYPDAGLENRLNCLYSAFYCIRGCTDKIGQHAWIALC